MSAIVDEARDSYRVAMEELGETVILRRQVDPLPAAPVDYEVRARVTGYQPQELVGGINQGDRKVMILAEDIEEAGFELPFQTNGTDSIVVRGTPLNIETVDDSTRRIAGTLIAVDIKARG